MLEGYSTNNGIIWYYIWSIFDSNALKPPKNTDIFKEKYKFCEKSDNNNYSHTNTTWNIFESFLEKVSTINHEYGTSYLGDKLFRATY